MTTDRYIRKYELGRGSNGIVTAEFDQLSGTLIARKQIHRVGGSQTELKQEFRILADISHPNLVSLYELESHDGQTSYTMELINGEDIYVYGRMHLGELRALFIQVLDGCAALFQHNVLHRDLKPSNILASEGHITLLDFGMAQYIHKPSTEGFAGTLNYASPEQIRGLALTPSSDLYSAARVFAEIIVGESTKNSISFEIPQLARESHPDAGLVDVLNNILQKDPLRRPTVGDVRLALNATGRTNSNFDYFGSKEAMYEVLAKKGAYVVTGESGVGKTRFLEELARIAVAQSHLVLQGASRLWEHVGFQTLDQIAGSLSQLSPDDVGLTWIERVALSDAFDEFEFVESGEEADPKLRREALVSGLGKLVNAVLSSNQLLITIDDLHWADADSIDLLSDLIEGDWLSGATVVFATRPEGMDAAKALESEFSITNIHLAPLTERDIEKWVLLKNPELNTDAKELHRITAGSPFYLTEVLHSMQAGPLTTLEDNHNIIEAKIENLSANQRILVEAICVCHYPIVSEALEFVFEEYGNPYYELMLLEKESWIRTFVRNGKKLVEAYHSNLREKVLEGLEDSTTQTHACLVRGIEKHSPHDFASLGYHQQCSNQSEKAGRSYFKAGIDAQKRLAFEAARDFYQKANNVLPTAYDIEHEIRLRHAQVLYNLGECFEAASLAERAPQGNYLDEIQQASFIGEAWISAGEIESGMRALSAILPDGILKRPNRRTLWLKIGFLLLRLRLTALKTMRKPVLDKKNVVFSSYADSYWSLGKLIMISAKHGTYFQLLSLVESLRCDDEAGIGRGLSVLANVYTHTGLFSNFGEMCMKKSYDIAHGRDDRYLLGVCALWQTQRLMTQYDWSGALKTAETALQYMEEDNFGLSWECTTAKNFLLMTLEKDGQIEELMVRCRSYLRTAETRKDSYGTTLFGLFETFWKIPELEMSELSTRLNVIRGGWDRATFTVQDFYIERVAVYGDVFHNDSPSAYTRIQRFWTAVTEGDILDIRPVAIDAVVMYATVLLNLENSSDDLPIQESEWQLLFKILESQKNEGRAYIKLFQAIRLIQKSDSAGLASLMSARRAFQQLGLVIPVMYIDDATLVRPATLGNARWSEMMIPGVRSHYSNIDGAFLVV